MFFKYKKINYNKRVKKKVGGTMSKDKITEGVHQSSEEKNYVIPTQKEVQEKLEQFKDMKLGFMTHFGLFTQFGMIESWALSDELKEYRWSQGGIDWTDDIEEFKDQYWNLNKSFNPGRIDPMRFANSISSLGFKYALMPTKHHDGFCLWDTAYSEYRTTHSDCPFSTNKHADIFGELTRAFQANGLMTGAYFSKADWHHEDYWPEEFKKSGAVHRNVGYDVNKHPEKWQRFVEFTENQMVEIVKNYEPIDIMWLDAGQVNARNNQDINMSQIASKMREINPGLMICDRTIGGEFENYITPEQQIPETYLGVPWETCMSLGGPFAYSYRDQYKSAHEITDKFVEILCKGGNLALNVAPQPSGVLPARAMVILTEFGDWVNENEDAIFGTRPKAPYYVGNTGFVETKDGKEYMYMRPPTVRLITPKYLYSHTPVNIKSLKYKGEDVKISKEGPKWRFEMPRNAVDHKVPLYYVFEIERGDDE